jgi:hypothetical protein
VWKNGSDEFGIRDLEITAFAAFTGFRRFG